MTSSLEQEQTWKQLLDTERQRAAQSTRIPLATRQKQIEDQITYYKQVLQQMLDQHQTPSELSPIAEKLISLRAQQTVYILLDTEKTLGSLPNAYIQAEVSAYTQDCVTLLQGISRQY